MRYLFVYAMCMTIVVKVKAHLPGASDMFPQPLVPVGSHLHDPFWTGPGMFRGGWNNAFQPQRGLNNFGQWPQIWDTQNTWNNGISTTGNRRNNFNNNGLASTDPWEQYRRFSFGVRSLTDGTGTSNGIATNTVVSQNQLTQSPVNNNYPWNTFPTQNNPSNTFATQNNFNTNIPAGINSVNQGFVSPQMQPNVNNQFQNQPFLSQRFPNRVPGVFV